MRSPPDHDENPHPFGDFDHLDPALVRDPAATYASMRRSCPVAQVDRHGGFVALSRYRDVWMAARDHDVFSSRSVSIPGAPAVFIPITLDGAEHDEHRAVLASFFSPRRVEAQHEPIRALTASLIDRFVRRGTCDVSAELTRLVPSLTLFRLIGVPADDEERLLGWTGSLIFDETATAEDGAEAAGALQRYLYALVRSRQRSAIVEFVERGDGPSDIIGVLLDANLGGRPLDVDAIVNVLITLVFGGLGPTTFLMNGALTLIDQDRDLRRRLTEDRSLLPTATEEFLRVISPVQSIGRVVSSADHRLDHDFAPGDRVLLLWGSANRDGDEFADAESFVADRAPNRHLAFGSGTHRCLGAHLARVEFRVVIDEVLTRLADFEVTNRDAIGWLPGHTGGIHRLPIRFTGPST
jgi:cytochrome P450